MNKKLLTIGIVITLTGFIFFAIIMLQPPNIKCVGNICEQKPPEGLYVTSLLPIFLLSTGIWMVVLGFKK